MGHSKKINNLSGSGEATQMQTCRYDDKKGVLFTYKGCRRRQ